MPNMEPFLLARLQKATFWDACGWLGGSKCYSTIKKSQIFGYETLLLRTTLTRSFLESTT